MDIQRVFLRLLLPASLLASACTFDVSQPQPTAKAIDTQSKKWAVNFQRQGSLASSPVLDITGSALKPGDLLFSSSIGVTSLGIRLISTSSVSHVAIYLGDEKVAEAVGAGVQIVSLQEAMQHSDKIFALRVPDLTGEEADAIRTFARQAEKGRYNYRGIIEFIPFMMTRQLCSLNPFSADFRQQCVNGLAKSQLSETGLTQQKTAWFCSEFVSDAFKNAGHALTMAEPGWISPADLLHMRDGDVAAFKPEAQLQYVGHLKPGIYIKAGRFVGLGR